MGLHVCQIEPDEGDGRDEGDECPECEGTGDIVDDNGNEHTCPRCYGSGVVEPSDPEPDMSEFI